MALSDRTDEHGGVGDIVGLATMAMVPVLVVFLCFQRYFVKGSLSGGVKG